MVDNATGNEELDWEKLRMKSRQRCRSNSRRTKIRLLNWQFIVGVLGMLICLIGIGVAVLRPQPLTLPESVQLQSLIRADTSPLQAEDFVLGLDHTGISVRFAEEPDEKALGKQNVVLLFSKGNETCKCNAELYRFHLESTLSVELGKEQGIGIRDFVPDERIEASFIGNGLSDVPQGRAGTFTLKIACQDQEYEVQYTITEDIPPQGVGKEVTVETGTNPNASIFVEKIIDNSIVTVTYQTPQEFCKLGKQTIGLLLTDFFGNTTKVQAIANVIPAANSPQFTGLTDLYLQVGATVSYKAGVTVTDAQDGALTFTVDTANFDNKTAGRYTVYYHATDSDGNSVFAPRTVVVESPTGQIVRQSAQEVLNRIIKPDMTHDEKINAIFRYPRYYVLYTGNSDKSSLENAAYEGFTKMAGDCYTYYAMVKVMLDILGIDNLEVMRIGGTSHHWWNLVLFEDGKYYHVDASPPSVKVADIHHEKMTDSDLLVYTNADGVINRRPNYYVYDKTLQKYQNIEIAE